MNLQFTNKGGNFVSEFEVTSDFNLHIEGVRLSDMHIYQKTAGGSYAKVTDFPSERSQDRVADFDFASLVYPKFIKVVCTTEPTYAEIATDGEVTEIKSQSKEVEITANGVTEIAPDAGFGYLSGVKVNVNVPTGGSGGEGGGASSGGDTMEYFNDGDSTAIFLIAVASHEVKVEVTYFDGTKGMVVGPSWLVLAFVQNQINNGEITKKKDVAYGIDMTRKVRTTDAIMTIKEYFLSSGAITETDLDSTPRITEEEFYNLGA